MKKVFGLFMFLFLMFEVSAQSNNLPNYDNKWHDYTLISVTTQEKIQGDFVLGFGSIDEITYFIVYIKNEQGTIKRIEMRADYCTIYEGYEEPYLHYMGTNGWGRHSQYILYVPKNTIISNFEFK